MQILISSLAYYMFCRFSDVAEDEASVFAEEEVASSSAANETPGKLWVKAFSKLLQGKFQYLCVILLGNAPLLMPKRAYQACSYFHSVSWYLMHP